MPPMHGQIHHPTRLITLSTPCFHSHPNYRFLLPHTPLPIYSRSQEAHTLPPRHSSPPSSASSETRPTVSSLSPFSSHSRIFPLLNNSDFLFFRPLFYENFLYLIFPS